MTFGISALCLGLLLTAADVPSATMAKGPLALIYRGPGACEECPEAVGQYLYRMGFQIRYVKPGELTEKNLSQAQLYVQPGGNDLLSEELDVVTPQEIHNVQEFVAKGGKYLGICYGGYLAGPFNYQKVNVPAFGLVPTMVEAESSDPKARLELIDWRGKDYWMYFQDGPQFDTDKIPGAEVWARYKKTGHGAALIAPYKNGFVGLLGPHPEAGLDWFEDDHLQAPDPIYAKLGTDFILALMAKKTAP